MIQDGKRLNIADVLINYRYVEDGIKANEDESAFIDFFGVNDSGSNFIGRQYLTTSASYIADTKLSITVGGFIASDYNHIYYVLDKGVDADKCSLDRVKFNYVISDLVLVTTPMYEIISYLGFLRMEEIQDQLTSIDLGMLRMAEIQTPFEGAMLRMEEITV